MSVRAKWRSQCDPYSRFVRALDKQNVPLEDRYVYVNQKVLELMKLRKQIQ